MQRHVEHLRSIAAALESGTLTDHDDADLAATLRRIADQLPSWPTGGSPEQLSNAGIPEVWHEAVRVDLDRVDSLERRMRAMAWPEIGRPDATAADPAGQLFMACRTTIVLWYASQWHRHITPEPMLITTEQLAQIMGNG